MAGVFLRSNDFCYCVFLTLETYFLSNLGHDIVSAVRVVDSIVPLCCFFVRWFAYLVCLYNV